MTDISTTQDNHVSKDKMKIVSQSRGLQATGLGKSFAKRRVVRNVTLNVKRGEAVGLLGPNGAGKTTTFYMLSGLINADEGAVLLDGKDITSFLFTKEHAVVWDIYHRNRASFAA